MLHDGQQALVVDPGDAQPVQDALEHLGLQLASILITHHHPDHISGVAALRQATSALVFGPAREVMPEPLTRLNGGATLQSLGLSFSVIDVPGHTAGHIAYFCTNAGNEPILFCGDTLFSGGCGRLFEGTPAQMLASLDRLATLPTTTRVCCAHEYTLGNLQFARAVEPDNHELVQYMISAQALRQNRLPTLPSSIGLECQINPFLRTRQASVVAAVQDFDASARDEVSIFAALREWKNKFQ